MSNGHHDERRLSEPSHDGFGDGMATMEEFLKYEGRDNYFIRLRLSGRGIEPGFDKFVDQMIDRELQRINDGHYVALTEDPNYDPGPRVQGSKLSEGVKESEEILEGNKDATQEQKYSTAQRFGLAALGLTLTAAAGYLALTLAKRYAKKEGTSDITQVDNDTKAKIKKQVDDWAKEPDAEYWKRLADMVDLGFIVNGKRETYTIADQLVFLNFTIALRPMNELWEWDVASDQEKNAEAIMKWYQDTKKISAIYRHVLDNKYQDRSLPRAVAARQLQVVLGWIAKDLSI